MRAASASSSFSSSLPATGLSYSLSLLHKSLSPDDSSPSIPAAPVASALSAHNHPHTLTTTPPRPPCTVLSLSPSLSTTPPTPPATHHQPPRRPPPSSPTHPHRPMAASTTAHPSAATAVGEVLMPQPAPSSNHHLLLCIHSIARRFVRPLLHIHALTHSLTYLPSRFIHRSHAD